MEGQLDANYVYYIVRATNYCTKYCDSLLKEELLPKDVECL